MDGDVVLVEWTLSIGFPSAVKSGTFEISREAWNALTLEGREQYIEEMYEEEIWNYIDGSWKIKNANIDDPTTEAW